MSRRQRQQRRDRHNGRGRGKVLLFPLGILSVLAAIGGLGLIGYIVGVAASAPDIDSVRPVNQGATSVVYAAGGERLGFIQSDVLRTPIRQRAIPPVIQRATIAAEDQRFFTHKGIDYEGVVRAALKNLSSGKTLQGGSTITMQLVRNSYISGERTFQRKVKEAKLAEELENEHPGRTGKEWILGQYLNAVSYGTVGGQSAIGIQAASRLFFNKQAKQLELHEAALLAGLPQAPSQYNPFREPRAARARRDNVLRRMVAQNMITEAEGAEAMRARLGVRENTYYASRRENYFFDFVREQLIEHYGVNTVRKGGLKVYTTIDLRLQKAARKAIDGQLYKKSDPPGSVVTIDPRNGYIKAMASSGSYDQNKFNYAAQGHRQAGSAFKTMVLMAALRRGADPEATTYVSRPVDLTTDKWGPWKVRTYSNSYGGTMNLVKATLVSDNTVYAQLALDLGPDQVKKTAKDMGIRSKLQGIPAEALGGLRRGVSPLEMANAYATIAARGWRNKPIAVRKVIFPAVNGKRRSDFLGKPKRKKVFEEGVTYEATKILKKNIESGTGTNADIGCPAGGKTGTTDEFSDAWFVGYTPRLATAVWMGYPNDRVSMTSVHGIRVAGGTFPAKIWGSYMKTAKGKYCADFRKPKDPASFSPFSGKRAGGGGGGNSFGDGYGAGGGAGGVNDFETGGGGAQGVPNIPPEVPPPPGDDGSAEADADADAEADAEGPPPDVPDPPPPPSPPAQ